MSGEFGTGKTIFVLAIVVGCFAVLWPKIFYPMLTASVKPPTSGRQESVGPHARPERPAHLYPEMMHPALREKGRAMPQRTIDKQARPGPMPGVRPPMGGAGGIVPPPQQKGSGAMGIIMPLYTVGIVVFFVYTIMKVLFKKGQEDDTTPKLKDFGLDPEYRKYVFAEEYLDNADVSTKDQMRRQAREESRSRKKTQQNEHQQQAQQPETKIGKSECEKKDEQLDQLRRRLEETEKAMERLMCQMGSVTDKLTAAKITEVLSQAQAQAKILKEEVGEMTSEEDLTSSEALTTTMSEETSLPTSLQRHLEQIQKNEESPTSSKGSSPDMDEYEVIAKDEDHSTTATKAKCLRKETATAKSEVKKIQIPIKKPEELEEEEEEVKEEEEEVEEEVETEEVEGAEEEVHKKGNERQTAESAKTKTSTQEMLDEE